MKNYKLVLFVIMLTLTPKQIQATKIMGENIYTLLDGGSRSGKTFIECRNIAIRAMRYPGTDHISLRLARNHAKLALWYDTYPKVFDRLGIAGSVKENSSDLFYEITTTKGKSRIWVDGLDTKERVEKIFGREYATIHISESSQIDYDTFDNLTTRLNPPQGIPPRFWLDQNPPSKKHWTYQIFYDRKYPDGRIVSDKDYAVIKLNPEDNRINLSKEYIGILDNLQGTKKLRFRLGGYGDEEGSLWKRSWFKHAPIPEGLIRVVVGVDPSGSLAGDEIGIIVAGIDSIGTIYVLADYSLHGTPKDWADEVNAAYAKFMADAIVAEKNFGGEMVESTITDMGRKQVNVKLVNASRGKIVRAEPIAALYEKDRVMHCSQHLTALEDELCTYKPNTSDSPNRMDALVWAVTELTSGSAETPYEEPYETEKGFI